MSHAHIFPQCHNFGLNHGHHYHNRENLVSVQYLKNQSPRNLLLITVFKLIVPYRSRRARKMTQNYDANSPE